jgi:hypothetical protein
LESRWTTYKKNVLVVEMHKTRPPGRPCTRQIDVITRDSKEIDQNLIFALIYNRDLLKAATILNGPVS